jgi:phosphatidylinositol alpha-mannosyltransferase
VDRQFLLEVSPGRGLRCRVDWLEPALYISHRPMKKKTLIGIAISAAVIAGLLRVVPPSEVLPYIRKTDLAYLGLACVINFGTIALRARRWQILVSGFRHMPFLGTFNMLTVGIAVSSVIPFRAGEAFRSILMAEQGGISKRESVSTVLLDKSFDAISFGVMLLLASRVFHHTSGMPGSTYGLVFSSIALVVSIPLVARLGRSVRGQPRERFASDLQHKIALKLEPLSRGYASLTGRAGIEALLLSILAWIVQFVVVVLVARAVGVGLPLGGLVAAVLAVNATSVLPLTPANIGVFQLAFLVAMAAYGAGRSSSLAVATVFQAALVIPVTLLGLALLHRTMRTGRQDKRAASST